MPHPSLRPRRTSALAAYFLALLAGSLGCNAYRLDPPAGFAEVSHYDNLSRMKAGDNVGLNVKVFNNVRGGTLEFWAHDLVRKLSARGYTLRAHEPITSGNGKTGTRFDFGYPNRAGEPKFYSVLLFVTDEHRVVVELGGDQAKAPQYLARLPEIAKSLKVRGCKAGSRICKGPQPHGLAQMAATPSNGDGDPAAAPLRDGDVSDESGG